MSFEACPKGLLKAHQIFFLRTKYCNNRIYYVQQKRSKRKVPDEPEILCAYCSEEVRVPQHAIQCDLPGCDRWQHRPSKLHSPQQISYQEMRNGCDFVLLQVS